MDMLKYVTEQGLVFIPVLYIIGMFLKQSSVQDKLIPWVLLALGVGMSLVQGGLNIDAFIQGVLVAGGTVLGNQLYKQSVEK